MDSLKATFVYEMLEMKVDSCKQTRKIFSFKMDSIDTNCVYEY